MDSRAAMLDPAQVDRRERWFVEGAAALRRTLTTIGLPNLLPPTGEFYACPCCLIPYGRDALNARVLTEEHVPPRALGGRELALTCATCNNTAGSAFDAHAERREAIDDFYAGGGPNRAMRAEFAVGNVLTRGNIHRAGDALLLVGEPKANDPKLMEEMTRTLNAWATGEATGARIGFRPTENMSVTRARLSWVRAAYVAAFAVLGWRYVLMSCLNPLRAQLADPTASLLPPLGMVDLAASRDRRQLFIVQEPEELRSIAVILGRYTVLLPWVEDPQPFEALSNALAQYSELPRPRPQLTGKHVPWPPEPLYALDR